MASPITAVIWDWNGTLLDDVEQARAAMNLVLADLGLPTIVDRPAYRAVFGFPIREFYARVGIDIEPGGQYESAALAYLAAFEQAVAGATLQPHARQVLAELGSRGLHQVLISATAEPTLNRQLAPHRLTDLLDGSHGITDPLEPSKTQVVRRWLSTSGHSPEQVVMVGDTNHDREIAAELGLRFIAFSQGHQNHAADGHPVIADLREVIALVDQLTASACSARAS